MVSIDPAETIIEGVSTYNTTLQFQKNDERIKSGMTANVNIFGEKRIGVVAIPQRALVRIDDKVFVRILKDETAGIIEEVEARTGLKGSDGYIEIISGVSAGDKIMTFRGE